MELYHKQECERCGQIFMPLNSLALPLKVCPYCYGRLRIFDSSEEVKK